MVGKLAMSMPCTWYVSPWFVQALILWWQFLGCEANVSKKLFMVQYKYGKSEICFLALAFPSRNWLKGRLADNCRNPIYFPVKTCFSWCFPFRFSLNQSIVPRKTSLILSGVACCVQGLKRAKSLCPSFANGSGKPSDLVVACFVESEGKSQTSKHVQKMWVNICTSPP